MPSGFQSVFYFLRLISEFYWSIFIVSCFYLHLVKSFSAMVIFFDVISDEMVLLVIPLILYLSPPFLEMALSMGSLFY